MWDRILRFVVLCGAVAFAVWYFSTPARAQACPSPVAQLEAEMTLPAVAATIKGVDRIEGEDVKTYLDFLGVGVTRNEDAVIVVLMGDEALVFGISEGCVIGAMKGPAEIHRRAMNAIHGTPS